MVEDYRPGNLQAEESGALEVTAVAVTATESLASTMDLMCILDSMMHPLLIAIVVFPNEQCLGTGAVSI